MKKSKATILVLTSLLATIAGAQTVDGRNISRSMPGDRHRQEVALKVGEMTHRAYALFRQGKVAEAERLATQALEVCEPLNLMCAEGDDVLAEAAMLRKEPREALRLLHHGPNFQDGVLSFRGQATRVLALLAVGEVGQARSALAHMAGSLDDPSHWRMAPGVDDLPMDGDPSPRALAATAYLMRASSFQQNVKDPEVLDDLREAERLAPSAVGVRLMLAKCMLERDRIDEAERYFTLVAAANQPLARRAGGFGLDTIRRVRLRRKAATGG